MTMSPAGLSNASARALHPTASGTHDIGVLLDHHACSVAQVAFVALAALSIVLDGFDGQLIGFALPAMMKDWGLARGDFSPVVAAGLVGMAFGSIGAGALGDRVGRRVALVASVGVFGLVTCTIGFAPDLRALIVLRFLAGLGIGGCLPTATTIAGEFTPKRLRAMIITTTIVCFPLGGMLAGLFSAYILPAFGWRGLFQIGGLLPVAFAALLLAFLPESPRFLARNPARHPQLARLLGRFGIQVAPQTRFVDTADAGRVSGADSAENRGFRALLVPARRRSTLGLWIAFFGCIFAVYSAFSWLPTMMVAEGFSAGVSGGALTAYNVGGVFGALFCAQGIARFGSRRPMILAGLGAVLSAIMLKLVPADQPGLFIVGFGLHGFLVNAVACTLYPVSAALYPTAARATGIAVALAFSRLGAILSAFVGAAVITAAGAQGYLSALAIAMLVSTVGLVVIRNQST